MSLATFSLLVVLVGCADALHAADPTELTRGFATLRAMDCARCHGRDYTGWTAPSLLDAVREGSRERFERYVLEGDVVRGMPGYREQKVVTDNLDAIYAWLLARSRGEIGRGMPVK